jgi:hypothetical protein
MYRESICNRILHNPDKEQPELPKFLILHENKAYEWKDPLNYWAVHPYMQDLTFLEDANVKSHHLKNDGMRTEEL